MTTAHRRPRFPLGRLFTTPGALEVLGGWEQVLLLLSRHVRGDWGEVCADDRAANEQALQNGERLLSAYTVNGKRVWIITEADRSATTVLLAEEY